MAIKTHKVTLSLDNPRVIQSGINVQSFDKQSIQISIELTKNDGFFRVPSDATIRVSLLKLARQEQKIIVDVPNTNRDSIDWVVPDYLDGYQGTVRVGVYLVSGAENVDLGYFTILSNVSDIDKMADEFTDNVFQGWEQIEADLNELNLTIAQTKLDLADDLTQIDNTIANINTLASDFTTDVATKQSDVTSKYNAFDTDITEANQTIDDILALKPQFQAVLDETTGKDVISAPEIILARGGAQTLGERLNEDKAEVTAQLAQTESKVQIIDNQKRINIISQFPNKNDRLQIVHVENNGNTLYGFSPESLLHKSVDGGTTWEKKGSAHLSIGNKYAFIKTSLNTLLFLDTGLNIKRSTDDGMTWATVHTLRPNTNLLNSQSWCVDGRGHIYYGEYETTNQSEIRIYKSSDDGASFQVFKSFAGPGSQNEFIRHIHTSQYDSISGRVYFCIGDNNYNAGIYRTNVNGDDIEPVLINGLTYNTDQYGRAVGLCFFPDYIVWGIDTPGRPWIVRIARSQSGQNGGVITPEVMFDKGNSSFLGVIKVNKQGTKWIAVASQEGTVSTDNHIHFYLIENDGKSIREVGSISAHDINSLPHACQIGEPTSKEEFWFNSQGIKKPFFIRASLSRTNNAINVAPTEILYIPETQNSGVVTVPASEFYTFGFLRVGSVRNRTIHIIDLGLRRDTSLRGWGNIQIYNDTKQTILYEGRPLSLRSEMNTYGLPFSMKFEVDSYDIIHFRIKEFQNIASFKGQAYVVYSI